jgi:hypothetical protein
MPCFLYQNNVNYLYESLIMLNNHIQYNQPSFSPASLLSYLIFTFIILSRIEFILPIQSRGRKINRTYSTFFLFTNLRSIACS